MPALFISHRLLRTSNIDIDDMAVSAVSYDSHGVAWLPSAVGPQNHYSFFNNFVKGQLWRHKYDFWDYRYDRLGINFICSMGDDLPSVMSLPQGDQVYLPQNATRMLQRHAVIDGAGLAVQFGSAVEANANNWHGIHDTYASDPYRTLAVKNVCEKPRGFVEIWPIPSTAGLATL